ncbi:MAG: hypothetical protein OM95_13195, partial [Bdellovibrio sp. ArHS]
MRTLTPFTATAQTNLFKIQAELQAVADNVFLLLFDIQGPGERILWPTPAIIESRQNELWKTTCLEAFLAEGPAATD